jgi:NAD(P)-dependent dehydrogenase (short-subunit alcohol dehydrogenase family)
VRTIAVTGAGSGMGASLAARLEAAGDRVIGIDLRNAEIQADLGTAEGRALAIDRVGALTDGRLDGLVTLAGLAGLPERPASLLISVNYFGTVEMLAGLRPLLARGTDPAAVAISSNSTTCQPGLDEALIASCLEGDEAATRALAGEGESLSTYPVTKTALSWWVRRQAPTADWAGAGITLNAVAPGAIQTPLLQEGLDHPTVGPLIDAFKAPLGRNGRPEEIAALIAYLLGPDARFFCGSVLFCDGGMDAQFRSDDWPRPWTPQMEDE